MDGLMAFPPLFRRPFPGRAVALRGAPLFLSWCGAVFPGAVIEILSELPVLATSKLGLRAGPNRGIALSFM
ncbi:MAG: hypothetical protein Kow0013_15390 [Pararhodobacter sp.]